MSNSPDVIREARDLIATKGKRVGSWRYVSENRLDALAQALAAHDASRAGEVVTCSNAAAQPTQADFEFFQRETASIREEVHHLLDADPPSYVRPDERAALNPSPPIQAAGVGRDEPAANINEKLGLAVEVVPIPYTPGHWLVEAVNHGSEGEVYRATFDGCDAEKRARDYAAALLPQPDQSPSPALDVSGGKGAVNFEREALVKLEQALAAAWRSDKPDIWASLGPSIAEAFEHAGMFHEDGRYAFPDYGAEDSPSPVAAPAGWRTSGPCAKATVRCTLVLADGQRVVGENSCERPQPLCPRMPGEDYTKCATICRQSGHAEVQAIMRAQRDGLTVKGARAYIEGHTYACDPCLRALSDAGVVAVVIASPPLPASGEGVDQ